MLALALGGRTIAEWQASMTVPEFLAWWEFFNLYPFDDFARFHRPAALVANSLNGRDITQSLAWLQQEPERPAARGARSYSDVEQSLIRAFATAGGGVVVKKGKRKAKG